VSRKPGQRQRQRQRHGHRQRISDDFRQLGVGRRGGAERTIQNVAPGVLGTDAVNVDQMNAALGRIAGFSTAYVDEQVGSLRKEAFQGTRQ
jgi:autotransporter adhesin